MKKLAVLISFSGEGGVEKMITQLLHEFAKRPALRIDLLLIRDDSAHLKTLPENIRQIRLKTNHSSHAVNEIREYLISEQPDAMLVAKDRAGRSALQARKQAKVNTRIVIRLGTTLSTAMAKKSALARWLRYAPIRRWYPLADHFVAVSQGVADDTISISRIKPEQISVVRNPVVSAKVLDLAKAPLAHPWFSTAEKAQHPVLLGAGRLTHQKGFDVLIKALAKVRERIPARLVIIGDGKLGEDLNLLALELGLSDAIDFAGFQSNPYQYMANASAFVLSSRWEGSPNVLTEAIALGTAVAACDCPSGPVELLDNGRYGPLAPVDDVDALAAGIVQILQNPLDSDTLKQAAKEYHAEISAERYLQLLNLTEDSL